MKGDSIGSYFYSMLQDPFFDDIEYEHVRKVALVEIAKRHVSGDRDIVNANINWKSYSRPGFMRDGIAEEAVIDALAEFDDEESHLAIISFWAKSPVIYITEACHRAFTKIARRHTVSDQVLDLLVNLFIDESENGLLKQAKLAKVLIEIHSKRIVPNLIRNLIYAKPTDYYRCSLITNVLSSYRETEVIQSFIESVQDDSINSDARGWITKALAESKGIVPFEVFETLLGQSESNFVRANAIQGLGKFSFEKTKDLVLESLRLLPQDDDSEDVTSFAVVQEAAIRVLVEHQQLELLLSKENRMEYVYSNSLDLIFEAIANEQLYSMIIFIDELLETRKKKVYREAFLANIFVKAAWTLADLGFIERAQSIIESLLAHYSNFTNGWVLHGIIGGINRLPEDFALRVVDLGLAEIGDRYDEFPYESGLCIETLARIGSEEACKRLVAIAERSTLVNASLPPEEAIRAIEFIAPRNYEDWLLSYLKRFPKSNALHRVIDTLGVIGTDLSIPILESYLVSHESEQIRYFSYCSIHQIYKRQGRLWFNDEERVIV